MTQELLQTSIELLKKIEAETEEIIGMYESTAYYETQRIAINIVLQAAQKELVKNPTCGRNEVGLITTILCPECCADVRRIQIYCDNCGKHLTLEVIK